MPFKVNFLDPNTGYRNNHLWLPLSHIENLNGIKSALTFPLEQTAPICAWEQTDTHLIVPREFIGYDRWKELSFRIVDKSYDKFPEVSVGKRTDLKGPVQKLGSLSLLENGNGVLSLACGQGKTVVALHTWTELKVPALVVVHTQDLLHQWRDRIVEHTTIREDEIGIIQSDKMNWEKPIVVSMIQTLASKAESMEYPPEAEKHFGVVIYDEVHHLGAPYFNASAAIGHGLRWGLSATWEREDGLDNLYLYHIGNVVYENMEQDVIPEAFFVRTHVPISTTEIAGLTVGGEMNFAKLCNWLANNKERNELVCSLIDDSLKEGRTILVLSHLVEHLEYLNSLYKGAGLIHGGVKGNLRQGILNNNDLIFATTPLAKEGLDRKDLDTIIVTLPFKKAGQLRQILGRIQRECKTKRPPMIIILDDNTIYTCRRMCETLRGHLKVLEYPFHLA